MKRYLLLVLLALSALPVGMSVTGCATDPSNYCPGTGNVIHVNQVNNIILQPQNNAISLAYGQVRQIATPQALNCLGQSVSVSSFTWGTSNPNLLDISPSGSMCAGVWEKNVGGGTPDYTICDPPAASAVPANPSQSYSDITASAQSVTSNQVQVYVHPVATSATVYQSTSSTMCSTPPTTACGQPPVTTNQCVSQNVAAAYCAVVCAGNEDISQAVGPITFAPANANIVSFTTPNFSDAGIGTAKAPGSTPLTAAISGTAVSAGVFATCPPASIAMTVNGSNQGATISVNNTVQLQTSVLDTKGAQMNSIPLTYSSTTPETLTVSTTGVAAPIFAGVGDIYAACLPTSCNPASSTSDIGKFGVDGNGDLISGVGQPLTSNPVKITTPGLVASNIYTVSFSNPMMGVINSETPTSAGSIKLPFVPNSVTVNRNATLFALGSATELMFVSPGTNTVVGYDNNIPNAKVLALNPSGSFLVATVPSTNLIYLYSVPTALSPTSSSTGAYQNYGGVATKAEFTPDGQTVYIEGYNTINGVQVPEQFVINTATGLTERTVGAQLNDVAVLTPAVGAFYAASDGTTALGYCTQTTPAFENFPPSPGVAGPPNDALYATTDGAHVLGADAATDSFNDMLVGIPTQTPPGGSFPVPDYCSGAPYDITATNRPYSLTLPAGAVTNSVKATPDSSTAIVTYSSTAPGPLPAYVIGTTDVPQSVPLAGGAIAPLSGDASPDSAYFYVGTSGDNQVHFISVADIQACAAGAPTCAADVQQVPTGIVNASGNPAPADAIIAKAYKALQ